MEYSEKDLEAFKEWLRKFRVPCPSCEYKYQIRPETTETVELSADEQEPFHIKTHDIYACVNPKCKDKPPFSYSSRDFNKAFLQVYKKK